MTGKREVTDYFRLADHPRTIPAPWNVPWSWRREKCECDKIAKELLEPVFPLLHGAANGCARRGP